MVIAPSSPLPLNQVVLVIGPPGAGKTTLGERLSSSWEAKGLRTQRIFQDSMEPHRLIQRLLVETVVNPLIDALGESAQELAGQRNAIMKTSRPTMFAALAVETAQAVQNGNIAILEVNPPDAAQLRALHTELTEKLAGMVDTGPTSIKIVNLVPRPSLALERVVARNSPQDHRPNDILGLHGRPKYEDRLAKEWANGLALGLNVTEMDGWFTVVVEGQTRQELTRTVLTRLNDTLGHIVSPTTGADVKIPEFMVNYSRTNEQRWVAAFEHGDVSERFTLLDKLNSLWAAYPQAISDTLVNELRVYRDRPITPATGTAHAGLVMFIDRLFSLPHVAPLTATSQATPGYRAAPEGAGG